MTCMEDDSVVGSSDLKFQYSGAMLVSISFGKVNVIKKS